MKHVFLIPFLVFLFVCPAFAEWVDVSSSSLRVGGFLENCKTTKCTAIVGFYFGQDIQFVFNGYNIVHHEFTYLDDSGVERTGYIDFPTRYCRLTRLIGKTLRITGFEYLGAYERIEIMPGALDYWNDTPVHCTNRIMDEDETGVDCGGSCPADCTPWTDLYYVEVGGVTDPDQVVCEMELGFKRWDEGVTVQATPDGPLLSGACALRAHFTYLPNGATGNSSSHCPDDGRWYRVVKGGDVDCYVRCILQYSDDYVPESPAHCSNGVLDGDETGVDCGGSCPSCSVPPGENPRDECLNISTSTSD